MNTTPQEISNLVAEVTKDVTYQALAKELAIPELGIKYTHGTIANLRSGLQKVNLRRWRQIVLHGKTERVREFARQVIRAEGFEVIE